MVTASYHLAPPSRTRLTTCRLNLDNVSLAQLVREAGSHAKLLDGRLQGGLQVSGCRTTRKPASPAARFSFSTPACATFPSFRMLGEMLRIDDLSHLEFKQAQLDYKLDGTVLQIAPLLLVSNDLRITAQGKYQTETDRLDLHARLTVDEAVSRQFPSSVLQQFQPDADAPAATSSIST